MMFTCRSGDVIELINTASDDWWKGSIGELKGYFPAAYVQVYMISGLTGLLAGATC